MRKFYFFKTSMEVRGGVNKNTLRALPGQFFDDGVAISTTFNVQSPKTPDATTTLSPKLISFGSSGIILG